MHFLSAKDNRSVLCKMQYYGVIEEICELHYSDFSVPVFCCKWDDNNNNVVHDDMGHTSMNLHKIGHKEDPYILACQAKQVFYMTDPLDKRRSIVIAPRPRYAIDEHDDNKAFIVPEDRRGYVLKQASKRWRAFKFRLRKEFMYESDEEGNTTDKLGDVNRDRAKKRKTSYRGGRKGYSYYEDEIIRAHSREEKGILKFDSPANLEIAQAIKALEAQHNQGKIDVTGRNDILARSLKTPEHGGCVRGVGGGDEGAQYASMATQGVQAWPNPKRDIEKESVSEKSFNPNLESQPEQYTKNQAFLEVDKQSVKELNTLSTQMPSSNSSFTKRVLAPIAPEEKLKLTTTLMRVCRKLAVEMKNGGKTIPIRIPNNVIYNEQDVCIDYEDMRDWCYQRMIGASHISTFMMHLSEMVHAQGISGFYGFCDSNFISPQTPTQENEDDRCDYLVRCPRQGLDVNCGFYVGRYMLETIQSRKSYVPDKYFDKAPATYSQKMIDDVQDMWITFVTKHQPIEDDDDDQCVL
uniref:DUF4216 domain-containing protein n=1 Tax=Chenopodium quinoa TaxID=63459 RepID=A0A803N4S6_CHEQI